MPVDLITKWEQAFYRYMDANHPEIEQEIIDSSVIGKNKMSDDLLRRLDAAIEEFKKTAEPHAEAPSAPKSSQEAVNAAAQKSEDLSRAGAGSSTNAGQAS